MLKKFLALILTAFCTIASAQSADEFIQDSVSKAKEQAEVFAATWHLGQETGWTIDNDKGELVLTYANGTVARTPTQVVGTLFKNANVFQWSWYDGSVKPDLRKSAILASQWGDKQGLKKYTVQMVPATEEDAYEFAAVAARLVKAKGVYIGFGKDSRTYMTYSDFQVTKGQELPATK